MLSSSPSSSTVGQMVTFTATVTPTTGSTGTPTGTVKFEDGTTVLGTALLGADGTASFLKDPGRGLHTITADYSGDANFAGGSGTTTEAVNQAGTATSLAAAPSTSTAGQAVTFTATVTSATAADGHRDFRGRNVCSGPPRSTPASLPSPSRPWPWAHTRSPPFTAAMPTSPPP